MKDEQNNICNVEYLQPRIRSSEQRARELESGGHDSNIAG
jgi:hypothetical protein